MKNGLYTIYFFLCWWFTKFTNNNDENMNDIETKLMKESKMIKLGLTRLYIFGKRNWIQGGWHMDSLA